MTEITIKAEHVDPFIRSTVDTLAKMAGLAVVPGKVQLREGVGACYDVTGVIGLSGGARGSVGLGFPRPTALAVVRAFSGEETVTTSMLVDAVGELANIVAGAAKRELAPYRIHIALPTVILGNSHAINGPQGCANAVVRFESAAGNFDLCVCFKSLA